MQSLRITDKLLKCGYIYASCIGELVIDLPFAKQFSTLEQNTDFLKAALIPFSSTAPVSESKCYFYRCSSLPWKEYRLLLWYGELSLFSFISWLHKSIHPLIFFLKSKPLMMGSPFTVPWSAACHPPKALLQIKTWLDSLGWPCEKAGMCLLSLPSKSTSLNLEVKQICFP